MGRLGDEDAAMVLFELLGDDSELIQDSAMGALVRMSPQRVTPLLLQALASPEVAVRIRAAETLGRLRQGDTAPALIALSKDPRETVRRAAIKALGEIDAAGVPDLLRAALMDESSLVRQQAVQSLGKLQEPETAARPRPAAGRPRPRHALRDPARAGPDPERRGGRQGGAVPRRRAQGAALRRRRGAGRDARVGRRPPAGPGALGAGPQPAADLRGEPRHHRRPAGGPAAAAGAGGRALERALLGRHRARAHRQRQGDRRRSLARLADEDATVRRAAVAALGEIGDARSAGRLVAALHDPALEAAALEALRAIGVSALPEMERAFAVATPAVRRLLVALVGKLEDRQGRKLLLAALADDTSQVRAEAALALGDGVVPRGRAPAHGPEGLRPLAAGAPGRRPGPEEAHAP